MNETAEWWRVKQVDHWLIKTRCTVVLVFSFFLPVTLQFLMHFISCSYTRMLIPRTLNTGPWMNKNYSKFQTKTWELSGEKRNICKTGTKSETSSWKCVSVSTTWQTSGPFLWALFCFMPTFCLGNNQKYSEWDRDMTSLLTVTMVLTRLLAGDVDAEHTLLESRWCRVQVITFLLFHKRVIRRRMHEEESQLIILFCFFHHFLKRIAFKTFKGNSYSFSAFILEIEHFHVWVASLHTSKDSRGFAYFTI